MVVGESFRVSRRPVYSVLARLSSGPPGGRPHARLKAGTPREAPTPAPTTKTPSPQQRIGAVRGPKRRGEHQPSNYWRGGKNCPALGAPCQHRDSTSHPSSEVGAGTYHWLQVNAWPQAGQWGSLPDCSGETCSLSEETKAPQRQQLLPPATRHDTAEEACHTPVGRASSGGARCRLTAPLD